MTWVDDDGIVHMIRPGERGVTLCARAVAPVQTRVRARATCSRCIECDLAEFDEHARELARQRCGQCCGSGWVFRRGNDSDGWDVPR